MIIAYGLFIALVVGGGLTHDVWVDEAETGMYGRSVLQFGVPRGFDGVNIFGYQGAALLNGDLINVGTPWVQFYLAAASLKLFGESVVSLRLPFMMIGLLIPWLTYLLTKELSSDKRAAQMAVWLVSLSAPLVLFTYQARYYSLSIVLGLVWLLLIVKRAAWKWLVVVGTVYIYTHWLSFLLIYMAGFCGGWYQARSWRQLFKWWGQYLVMGIAVGVTFVPWLMYSKSGSQGFYLAQLADIPGHWWYWFWQRIGVYRLFGVIPVGLWLVGLLRLNRGIGFLVSFGFFSLIAASGLGAIFLSTAINPANQRYLLVLLPVAAIISGMMMARLVHNKLATVLVMGIIILTNGLSLVWPIKWVLFDYVQELIHPSQKPYQEIAKVLDRQGKPGETVFVSLERGHEPLMFYLGKKFKFVNRAQLSDTNIFPLNREVLPRYTYFFSDSPDFVVLLGKRGNDGSDFTVDYRGLFPKGLFPGVNLERDYEEMVLSISFKDTFRPELEWHVFNQDVPNYKDQIFVYHKII